MNILGIDYGQKRVGLAWVQEGLDVVLPFGLIESEDDREKIEKIAALVSEESIGKIVLGLPEPVNGRESPILERAKVFGQDLGKETGVPVECMDEKFSSKQADAMGGDVSRDEKAAMVILQSYLDKQ